MRRDAKSEGLLVFMTLIWGGTFVAIKDGLQDISPMLMVGIRFLVAAALAYPILARRRPAGGAPGDSLAAEEGPAEEGPVGEAGRFSGRTWLWGAVIGLGMLAGYAGQTIGLKYTTVARSGFITYSFALFVPFLQFFILGRKPDLGNLLGLFVVFWGLSFLTDPSGAPLMPVDFTPLGFLRSVLSLMNGGMNRGDLLTLLGSVGYAFYVVLLDKATRRCPPGEVTVVQMFACGVFALILSPLIERPEFHPSWRLAGAMFYLIVPGSILALALMNWFQRKVTPLRAVLIYALEPVFASILGWMVLGEGLSAKETVGAVLILGGILVSDLWGLFTMAVRRRRERREGLPGA